MSPSVSDQTTANISNFAPISSNSRSCQHSHTRRSLQLSMTIIRLILIAMLVGVCTASPVRARASAGDASNTPQKVQASFGNRILNYHNVGPKEVVVGYAWLKTGATTRVTPKEILEVEISDVESLANSHAANSDTGSSREPGQNAARKALERLEILLKSLQTINTIEYNYFFPSPNYFDDLVPLGKGWTQLRNLNQLDMVYIPETVDTNYKMIKKHIESYKDKNEKHNESYTDKNAKLSAVTVLAELGGGHYVLLVPSPGKFRFKVSFDVKATDLPAARWEALNGVKKQRKLQRGIPKQFF
ncbi:hypothetical protein EV368DRAFT_68681 [Lentinula lateritia]|uniref:Uncharacterized protein n=1 Tax=Lentinula aff. lateritia TaxID=2804960 RepID=A0ACC1TWM7_9AGAR|nr:hypothetical protein F5876DRAFT_66673 [Lentinula aff. lateritia]KAJ3847960.1 hypothetical protein EV368DRAFT_68681 [Lentinula lateritia]